jgi:3-phenylpropionate/cinnamic acid dioxygenase small subunit
MTVDEYEIAKLVIRYATALDTRDWQLLSTTLAPEIIFTPDGFEPLVGYEAIRTAVSSALEGQDSQHYVTNMSSDVVGDEATSRSYLQAQHIRNGTVGGSTYLVAGVYDDQLRRTPDGWRFTRRNLSVLWTRGNPTVPLGKVAGR